MSKIRKHERVRLRAGMILHPDGGSGGRLGGQVLNVSRGGLAALCAQALPVGTLVSMELIFAMPDEGIRRVILFGVSRWVRVLPEGNMLGIEFLKDEQAGDYGWFAENCTSGIFPSRHRRCRDWDDRAGFTLVELSIAMVIICLMATLAAPIFARAIEQSRVDAAAANLKGLWAAQRVYWLEEGCFASLLSSLQSMDLVDSAIADSSSNPNAVYVFDILSADESHFVCRAMRHGSSAWTGEIRIDEEGAVSGTVTSRDGHVLTPTQ